MTSVVPVLDRVLDADSHTWRLCSTGSDLGTCRRSDRRAGDRILRAQIGNDFYAPEHKGDVTANDYDSVWKLKGTSTSPGGCTS
jgi:hypothetical protein